MTNVFALSVPTDIPWRRVCASGDMFDADPCDLVLPPRWRSSIALFRYDPEDSFQPYPDLRITYLKLTVTLTPFAPELDIQLGRREVDAVAPAFPCYGALLHVTVAPSADQRSDLPRQAYPYFLDVEPKKRELYELVTDYDAPPDFEIVGYDVTLIKTARVIEGPVVDHDKKHLSVRGKVSWRFEEGKLKAGKYENIYLDGHLHADVRVRLRSTRPTVEEKATRMFLAARQLCCCSKTPDRDDITALTYERALSRPFAAGFAAASPARLRESRALAAELRGQLERSLSSPARLAFGARTYRTSDTLAATTATLLGETGERPATVAGTQFGLSWRELLGDVDELAERLGLTEEAAGHLRRDAIEHALRLVRQERRR